MTDSPIPQVLRYLRTHTAWHSVQEISRSISRSEDDVSLAVVSLLNSGKIEMRFIRFVLKIRYSCPDVSHGRDTVFRIVKFLRDNPDRWYTSSDVSRQLHIRQNSVVHLLRKNAPENVEITIDENNYRRFRWRA